MADIKVPPTWGTIVPLPEVARVADANPMDLYNLIRRGQLNPLPQRGPRSTVLLTRDDAINLLMTVALALAAGIAIATAYRAIAAGATFPVSPG